MTRIAPLYAPLLAPTPPSVGRLADASAQTITAHVEYYRSRGGVDFSRFGVFEYTRAHLLCVAARHGLMECTLDELWDAYQVLANDPSPDARLAEVFSDLAGCASFDRSRWPSLLELNPAFIRLAAENCAFINWTSGADGVPALRTLVSSDAIRAELIAHALVLRSSLDNCTEPWAPNLHAYIDRILHS